MELLRDPDAELVAACRDPQSDGFEAAFETLFHRYRERVFAIAFRITGKRPDALDVVQESFALLFRKLGSFRNNSLFSTWLFRIVVNCSIDHRRKTRVGRWPTLLADDEAVVDRPDEAPGPRDHASVSEVGDQVQQAISHLSPKLRVILALRYLEEMSYEELATTLELSMGTVKSRLARAHLALEHVVRTRFPHLDISKQLEAEDDEGGVAGNSSDSVGGVG